MSDYFVLAESFESSMVVLTAKIKASDGSDWVNLNSAYCRLYHAVRPFGAELLDAASEDAALVSLFRRFRVSLNHFERARLLLAAYASRDNHRDIRPTDLMR